MPSYFTPGAPLYTEEGGEILKGPRNVDAAKRLLAESGYAGQPVTCLAAQDIPFIKAWGEMTSDLLKRLGMKADLVALDSGTLFARMPQKSPPAEGGWNMFLVSGNGAVNVSPAQLIIRANGDGAWFGWPNSPQVETEVAAWYDAKTLDEEKAAVRRLNRAAFDHVVYAPLGFFQLYQAWRKNLTGIVPSPLPFFWGVSKTA
jgi:peptide/nickel transport system substrate-binding protein